jgi:hypothetical protein
MLGEPTIVPYPRAVAVSVGRQSGARSHSRVCASLVKLGDAAIGRERVFRAERSPDLGVTAVISFRGRVRLMKPVSGQRIHHARETKVDPVKAAALDHIFDDLRKHEPPSVHASVRRASLHRPMPTRTRLFEFLRARFRTAHGSRVEGDGAEKVVATREEQERKQEGGDRVARQFCGGRGGFLPS